MADYYQTDRIIIRCDKVTPINLDGEIRMAQNVEMKIAKEKLRFFYPKGLSYEQRELSMT